jgi:PAS domain S-box-containing protein
MQDNPCQDGNDFSGAYPSAVEQADELQQLYEEAPCGYHSLDENGVFIRINRTELAMLGYSRGKLIGKKKFYELLTPESQKVFEANFPIFKKRGWVRDLEFNMIRKDGSILPVSLSSIAIKDKSGKYVISRSVVLDISDRKRLESERRKTEAELQSSENRYRILFESNPNPMWIYDPETLAFLEVNQAAIAHYGYSKAEFLQMTIADIRPSIDVQVLRQTNLDLVPGQPHVGVWQHRKKDASLIDVEVMAHAFLVAGKQANLALIKDITVVKQSAIDRQRTEVALREAHQRIVATWESMTDAYASFDFDWRFTYVNQAAVKVINFLTNTAPEEILNSNFWEVFPLLLGGELEFKFRQALVDRMPAHFDYFYESTENWFELHAYPSPIGLGVYFRDITEAKRDEVVRKTAETQLLLTEERLRYLLSSNPAVLYACQATGDYAATFISDNISGMLGHEGHEFLEDSQFWASHIHPEDAPQVFTGLTHLFEQGTHTHEYRFLHRDGSYRWVLDELKLIRDAEGNPLEIVGYWIDITDRKQAEQKILEQANLLAIATDAIFVHDLDNRILFWNQGAERLYDWKAADIVGKDWQALLSPDTLSELETVIQQGTWQGEVPKVTQAGKEVVVMSRRSLMLDEAGQPRSILTVDTDITEKKQLETQFLRTQRLESLGTLASGIAHDLNNVLTPIIGIVQLLPQKIINPDSQTQRLLQILNDSSRRGADLVKQILSFTRGVEGKPTNTQISHLLAEIYKVSRQTFPKNIDLSVDLSKDLWLITADATLLYQVFMNLCVNARDAMPNGGTLSISAENFEIDENYTRMNLDAQVGFYVVVTIADTGMGMSPEVRDRIFEPFFTTKEVGKGTGLGLSTVMGIVKTHQGFINVYSEVGNGTQFAVYLPATNSSEITPAIKAEPLLGQGELILVVDDEIAIQEITQATLENHGYKVMSANDGIEAIALYAEHKHDISVVLLDLMMPSLDSATTIRTLHKLNPQVQIIAMSGLTTNESVARTMSEGVQAFLSKPFTAPELLNLLSPLCKKN